MLNLIILPFILGLLRYRVVAQQATCTSTAYTWMYNSLEQDPCTIAVKLGGVCNGGIWVLDLLPPGKVYAGDVPPTMCDCNTVTYSLMAACSVCQGRNFMRFSAWTINCTAIYSRRYPENIPYDTAVPHYAYLDVLTPDTFDLVGAKAAGGPESTSPPRSTYNPTLTTSSTSNPTGPTQSNSTILPTTAKTTNVGAIAGGVSGAVVGLAVLGVLVFFLLRRRRASPFPMAQQTPAGIGYSPYPSSPAPGPPSSSTSPLATGSPQLYPTTYANQVPTNYTNSNTTSSIIAGRPMPQYIGAPGV